MFTSLLESGSQPAARIGGSIASTIVHALLIGGAIVLTAQASESPDEPREVRTVFTRMPEPTPVRSAPRTEAAPASTSTAAAPSPAVTPLIPPLEVPDLLSAIDLSRSADVDLNAELQRTRGTSSVVAGSGSGAAVTALGSGDVYSGATVDRAVRMRPGTAGPAYPEQLRAAGIQGTVLAEFVVDTTGRVMPASVRIVATDHPLFADAVRDALLRARFTPADAAGHKVRQLVQQPFGFRLDRE